jgi:LmbE family N-acetylglucosaminyl deacetylase
MREVMRYTGRRNGIRADMAELAQLYGRTLFLVAHPDDEVITFGALLQRAAEPLVIYATNGSPQDPYFWKNHGTREAYSALRQEEARRALGELGVSAVEFLPFVDQELFRTLDSAYARVEEIAREFLPKAIVTLAYEGGHPDHDSCSLLAAVLGDEIGVPVWEGPIYNRSAGVQRFAFGDAGVTVGPTESELSKKLSACKQYPSQGDFLGTFSLEREVVRAQAKYDYSRPPHEGRLNYEAWQWSMTGQDVCTAFTEFLRARTMERREVRGA